jgi:hypothetical protein
MIRDIEIYQQVGWVGHRRCEAHREQPGIPSVGLASILDVRPTLLFRVDGQFSTVALMCAVGAVS